MIPSNHVELQFCKWDEADEPDQLRVTGCAGGLLALWCYILKSSSIDLFHMVIFNFGGFVFVSYRGGPYY